MLLATHNLGLYVLIFSLAASLAVCSMQIDLVMDSTMFCGDETWGCCHPSFATDPALGPIVSCYPGLGCDIVTHKCVSPCGSPGEVCCDGSDTRAPMWSDSYQTVFSPVDWASRKEMCSGGYCDQPTHRCIACPSTEGSPCCPRGVGQQAAQCNGQGLLCKFDDASESSGTCVMCGELESPPCGIQCNSGLHVHNGLCVFCGDANQQVCDLAEYTCNYGCQPNLIPANGFCFPCGDVGEVPCGVPAASCINSIYWYHCKQGLGMLRGHCEECGFEGKPPCDGGCLRGYSLKNGLCTTLCGHENQPPCDGGKCLPPFQVMGSVCKMCGDLNTPPCPVGGCRSPYKVRNRVCEQCGGNNQVPCDRGCDPDLLPENGLCSSTCGLDVYPPCDSGCRDGRTVNSVGYCVQPANCAGQGQECVSGYFGTSGTGLTCCAPGGPFVCNFGRCQPCIPHGHPVPTGGTQICCQPGDTVVIDLDSGGAKCDIPDGPDN
jgi:hypothetical protein